MLKHRKMILTAVLAAACTALTVPVSARLEADPQYGDVILMYAETRVRNTPDAGDALCKLINTRRSEAGADPVTLNGALMEQAAKRVEQLSDGSGRADAGTLEAPDASETVIRGNADINTMICSILLSEKQTKNLFYPRYSQFGYACNEENTVWVLLMTSCCTDS